MSLMLFVIIHSLITTNCFIPPENSGETQHSLRAQRKPWRLFILMTFWRLKIFFSRNASVDGLKLIRHTVPGVKGKFWSSNTIIWIHLAHYKKKNWNKNGRTKTAFLRNSLVCTWLEKERLLSMRYS